jgi:hypothetical protein
MVKKAIVVFARFFALYVLPGFSHLTVLACHLTISFLHKPLAAFPLQTACSIAST